MKAFGREEKRVGSAVLSTPIAPTMVLTWLTRKKERVPYSSLMGAVLKGGSRTIRSVGTESGIGRMAPSKKVISTSNCHFDMILSVTGCVVILIARAPFKRCLRLWLGIEGRIIVLYIDCI